MKLEFFTNGMVERGDYMSVDDGYEVDVWRSEGNLENFGPVAMESAIIFNPAK